MDALILSGFLGCGKTTLLLQIAKAFSEIPNYKLAIIENEAGKVGMDAEMVRQAGISVRELYAGCICCSLRTDLQTTIAEIKQLYAPDLIIIEPTGIASPTQIATIFQGCSDLVENHFIVSILDASRLLKVPKEMLPFLTAGIMSSDISLLNKQDAVTSQQLKELYSLIESIRPGAHIVATSANDPKLITPICSQLVQMVRSPRNNAAHSLSEIPDTAGFEPNDALKYSKMLDLQSDLRPVNALKNDIRLCVEKFISSLKIEGCSMVGHVKALLKSEDGQNYIAASATDFDNVEILQKSATHSLKPSSFIVNAIVYNVSQDTAERLFLKSFVSLFRRQ